jgi:glycosyltransferase involved in cell wall biosynthesis
MAKRAIEILSDEKIHHQFKKNALAQARNFDIGKIVPQYEALYRRVIV